MMHVAVRALRSSHDPSAMMMMMMIIASGGDGGDAEMQMLAHKKLLNVFECSSISQLNRFQFRCIPCLQFARHHRPQFA